MKSCAVDFVDHSQPILSRSRRLGAILSIAILALCAGRAAAETRLGVGAEGPISPQAEYDIERLVGSIPNIKSVPIQPPGDVDACVKRFVAGDADDRLDGVMIVRLPTDSFITKHDANEATFTGTYEIWLLNLSTLAEDRHTFTFEDREPVIGGVTAILTIPAQLFTERATGGQLIASNVYQAYQAVQTRVESKLVAATRLYLDRSPIKEIGALDPLQCAQALIDRGDGDAAMLVFKSAGSNNPRVQQMIAGAQDKLRHAEAQKLLGRTLGAIAGDNPNDAAVTLASYEKTPAAEPSRAQAIRSLLASLPRVETGTPYDSVLANDVPGLDHAALVAMLTQLFADQTGSSPEEVIVSASDVKVEDKQAPKGMKTHLDSYARALGRSARVMSLKCGCAATATLTAEVAGAPLLRARFEPSFKRPEVGLP